MLQENLENINIICCDGCVFTYAPEVGPVDGDCESHSLQNTYMHVFRIVGTGLATILVSYLLWHLNSSSHVV